MSSPPNYREQSPGLRFAGWVDCYWTSALAAPEPEGARHEVLPDGCMDLLFDFAARGDERVEVVGTMTRPLSVLVEGPCDLLGVRFRPGALPSLLALEAGELTDGAAPLEAFWGSRALELWERLAAAAPARRIRLLEAELAAEAHRLGDRERDPFVADCVRRIEDSRGNLRLRDLEASSGLGLRQLERKFVRHVGVGPKTFARVVRFRAVVEAAEAVRGAPAWAALAQDLGYSDQAHLSREFRSLSGIAPTEYARLARDGPGVGFLQDAGVRID